MPPPLIFVATLGGAIAMGIGVPTPLLPFGVHVTVGPLIMAIGVVLIRASMADMKSGNTTYSPIKSSTSLVIRGIFKYSRNPGYLGLGVVELGFAVLLDNVWIVPATLIAGLIVTVFVIHLEEEKLLGTFGDAYAEYCAKTRRWI